MSQFIIYAKIRDITWYRCINCGALQRGTPPPVCPVCEDRPRNPEQAHKKEEKDA